MNYALSAEILARTPDGPIVVAEWHTSRPLTLQRARKRLAKRIRRSRAAAYEVRRSPLYPLAFEITAQSGSRIRFSVVASGENPENSENDQNHVQ